MAESARFKDFPEDQAAIADGFASIIEKTLDTIQQECKKEFTAYLRAEQIGDLPSARAGHQAQIKEFTTNLQAEQMGAMQSTRADHQVQLAAVEAQLRLLRAEIQELQLDCDKMRLQHLEQRGKKLDLKMFEVSNHLTATIGRHTCVRCCSNAARKCARCGQVYYCCRDCQVKDWPLRRITCLEYELKATHTVVCAKQTLQTSPCKLGLPNNMHGGAFAHVPNVVFLNFIGSCCVTTQKLKFKRGF
eukprot:TRINITY_DN66822_c2_g1_i2.p1 TRINITY_DN66822_c2_g1~~TRINITY_DN66822_c2_g1_i2.p1  ORF type:complete len:246 (+),score=8.00 TRINITY_DN66822_c2_g1_i2:198-935(+)